MPTKFNMTKDVAGYNGFGLVPSTDSYAGLLATSVADSVVVPSEYPQYLAVLSYTPGSNVWVNNSGAAAAPAGAIGASASELNPAARLVKKGTTLSFLTADTAGAYVSVLFYVAGEFGN
jgi:hypothetical protein